MSKQVTLRDANQRFAKLIRAVEAGEEFIVTRRGIAVARLASVGRRRVLSPAQLAARRRSRARLSRGLDLGSVGVVRRTEDAG